MKLLTNKQFQRVLEDELAPLKEENEKLYRVINNREFRYLEECDKLRNENEEYKKIITTEEEFITELNEKINSLKEEKKLLYGAKGGLTKQVHKLEKELAEANEKLSQRYIVKELKPTKPRKTQTMKIKSGSVTSKIIKKVVEDESR